MHSIHCKIPLLWVKYIATNVLCSKSNIFCDKNKSGKLLKSVMSGYGTLHSYSRWNCIVMLSCKKGIEVTWNQDSPIFETKTAQNFKPKHSDIWNQKSPTKTKNQNSPIFETKRAQNLKPKQSDIWNQKSPKFETKRARNFKKSIFYLIFLFVSRFH